jgi:hypothetical protein
MIYFRDRKYGATLNTSFFAKNGGEHCDLSRFHTGDKVSIFFRLTPEQEEAIADRDDVPIEHDPINPSEVFIPFRVVERSHALCARGGELRIVGESLVLEAETGVGEDIVRWVCCGERPAWAE